jgi:guanine deaminase
MSRLALRSAVLHFTGEPDIATGRGVQYLDDAILLVEEGRIADLRGAAQVLADGLDPRSCEALPGRLILPGFIDAHVHYPQIDVIASYGERLLSWLEQYTFPAETAYADPEVARAAASDFLDELLRQGTTTAMVFATSHPASAEALFAASHAREMRMITGKVLMDRHAPPELLDTPDGGNADSRELLERWHGTGRQRYAITPRFAGSSSPEQLHRAGRLWQEFPDAYIQSHLSETPEEVSWIAELFPESRDYLDVYERFGLVGQRSVFAHGIHLSDAEVDRLAASRAVIAFCPTSNLFLGSGLLDLDRLRRAGVRLAIASDVGAGFSLSMLKTLAEGYKVAQLQRQAFDPYEALYLATLGNARALALDEHIGHLQVGAEADFNVIDWSGPPLLARRADRATELHEKLFALLMLGDDRCIERTYVLGRRV